MNINSCAKDGKEVTPDADAQGLTSYHWERSVAAQKTIAEMLENPLSTQQQKEQMARLESTKKIHC